MVMFAAAGVSRARDLDSASFPLRPARTAEIAGTPIAMPGIGPAPFSQAGPSIATDGEIFLAVWADERRTGRHADLFAARLDAEGRVVDAFGFPIARIERDYSSAVVVWSGEMFVVFWADSSQVYAVRITRDGVILDREPVPVTSTSNGYIAVYAGDGVILMRTHSPIAGNMFLIDAALRVTPVAPAVRFDTAVFDGTSFVLIHVIPGPCEPCASASVTVRRLFLDGTLMDETTTSLPYYVQYVDAALSASGVLRIALAGGTVRLMQMEPNGTLTQITSTSGTYPQLVAAGDQFLLVWLSGDKWLAATHTTSGLHPLPQPPQALSAISATASKAVFLHARREFPRDEDVFLDVLSGPERVWRPREVFAKSGAPQYQVRVAATRGATAAVWLEGEGTHDLRAAVQTAAGGGGVIDLPLPRHWSSSAAIAGSRDQFLVISPLGAVRIAEDGTLLDRVPLQTQVGPEVAVASDGLNYLGTDGTRGQIVRSDGSVLPPFALSMLKDVNAESPALSWSGENYVVTWEERHPPCRVSGGACPTSARVGIFAARVLPDGTVLDLNGLRIADEPPLLSDESAVANNAHESLVTWVKFENEFHLRIASVSRDGVVLPARTLISSSVGFTDPAAVWTGREFLIIVGETDRLEQEIMWGMEPWVVTFSRVHQIRMTASDAEPEIRTSVLRNSLHAGRFDLAAVPARIGAIAAFSATDDPEIGYTARGYFRHMVERMRSAVRR